MRKLAQPIPSQCPCLIRAERHQPEHRPVFAIVFAAEVDLGVKLLLGRSVVAENRLGDTPDFGLQKAHLTVLRQVRSVIPNGAPHLQLDGSPRFL